MSERKRVFVRRRGRSTTAQSRALETLGGRFCVSEEQLANPSDPFGREAPLALEVGFGMGQALTAMASAHPDWNWLGIDVYRPGIGAVLNACDAADLGNVRIAEGDARDVVAALPPASVRRICVFFPDPWPKKRHQKRRLLNEDFATLLASRLEPGGTLLVATDWEPYARDIVVLLDACPGLQNQHGAGAFAPRHEERPETRFEARGKNLGHAVWDLEYQAH